MTANEIKDKLTLIRAERELLTQRVNEKNSEIRELTAKLLEVCTHKYKFWFSTHEGSREIYKCEVCKNTEAR